MYKSTVWASEREAIALEIILGVLTKILAPTLLGLEHVCVCVCVCARGGLRSKQSALRVCVCACALAEISSPVTQKYSTGRELTESLMFSRNLLIFPDFFPEVFSVFYAMQSEVCLEKR